MSKKINKAYERNDDEENAGQVISNASSSQTLDRSKKKESIKRKSSKTSKQPGDEPKKIKRISEEKPGSTKSERSEKETEIQTYVELCRKIGKALGTCYVDVINRLKLDMAPRCVVNNKFCETNHSKKCERPDPVGYRMISLTKFLSKRNRYFHSIKFIEDFCFRELFPGEDLMHHLLRMILTTTNPSESKAIIEESSVVFMNIVNKFPPCWYDIQNSYRQLFLGSFDIEGANTKNLNIMEFILTTLESLIHEDDRRTVSELSDDEDDYMSYDTFEQKYTFHPSFDSQSRTEKIDRLFIVLELLIKILEYDLPIWIRRHLRTTYERIYDDNKKPLITYVFFDGSYNNITTLVKKSLSVFVKCICYSYPQRSVDITSRLVSLISHATYLCERNTNEGGIKYPFFSSQCETLTKEIFKTIDGIMGRNLRFIFAVAENIKAPFIKLSLVSLVLNLLNNTKGSFDVETVFNDLNIRRWLLECRPDDLVNKTPKKNISDTGKQEKYPVVDQKRFKRPKSDEISRKDYLKVLLSALNAYCDVYDIKRISKVFSSEESSVEIKPKAPSCTAYPPLDLSKMQKDIHILEKNIDRLEKRKNADENCTTSFDGILVDHEVALRYRNDLKYILLLKRLIGQLENDYGEVFKQWREYLDLIIPS